MYKEVQVPLAFKEVQVPLVQLAFKEVQVPLAFKEVQELLVWVLQVPLVPLVQQV